MGRISSPQKDNSAKGDGQPQEPAKVAGPWQRMLLVAPAKASRITGQQVDMKIDGATFEPVEALDKAAAIEAAYALYAESFSDPSQGG